MSPVDLQGALTWTNSGATLDGEVPPWDFDGLATPKHLSAGGGLASGEDFGTGVVLVPLVLSGGTVPSEEAFGGGLVLREGDAVGLIDGGGIPSGEAFAPPALGSPGYVPPAPGEPVYPTITAPEIWQDDPAVEPEPEPVEWKTEIEVFVTGPDLGDGEYDARRMFQYSDLVVEHPLNDARLCRFTCPIEDINALRQSNVAELSQPLERYVKVYYRGYLVFWGPILKPIFNFATNQVEVNAHDMSYWVKRHFVHRWDEIVRKPLAPHGRLQVSEADAPALALRQFEGADNMTDRQGALGVLANSDAAERETALAAFYERYRGNALVIDKWFTAQALSTPRRHARRRSTAARAIPISRLAIRTGCAR